MSHNSKSLKKSNQILVSNTFAFTMSFMVWLMYGSLITFLTTPIVIDSTLLEKGIFPHLTEWKFLILSTPILTGSIMRLPVGILTDKFGGKPVYFCVLLISAIGAALTAYVESVTGFIITGLIFGMAGTSFAVGIAFSSVWFPKEKQGFALGIFGSGNAGAAITNLLAPILLASVVGIGAEKITATLSIGLSIQAITGITPENWTQIPLIYSGIIFLTAIIFWLTTENKKNEAASKTLSERLSPLKNLRVWRFGAYYFLLFGGFVALSLTLSNYYQNVFHLSLKTSGLLVAIMALLSAGFRAVGGSLSDSYGARTVMYWVLIASAITCAILGFNIPLFPFIALSSIVGIIFGIGMAGVYKHIPVYFPKEVGVVGAMVGVLGGLGGFILPNVFKYLLSATQGVNYPFGNFATSWVLLTLLSIICLVWMHIVIKREQQ